MEWKIEGTRWKIGMGGIGGIGYPKPGHEGVPENLHSIVLVQSRTRLLHKYHEQDTTTHTRDIYPILAFANE